MNAKLASTWDTVWDTSGSFIIGTLIFAAAMNGLRDAAGQRVEAPWTSLATLLLFGLTASFMLAGRIFPANPRKARALRFVSGGIALGLFLLWDLRIVLTHGLPSGWLLRWPLLALYSCMLPRVSRNLSNGWLDPTSGR